MNSASNRPEKGTTFMPPLEEVDYKVKQPCPSGHAPWPQSICTKCQPSAVSLQQQSFRMVDHVEFSSSAIVETFLNFWRSSGLQRFGYLYGRFEVYQQIPLGIKALVEAIYEPPQRNEVDGIALELPWDGEHDLDAFAKASGLERVSAFANITVLNKIIGWRHLH